MSDTRVDILTAHYVKENSHPQYASNEDDFTEAQFEAQWTIKDLEAAGLVVIDADTFTRVTVVDWRTNGAGRALENWDVSVQLAVQDDGRTLKVFMRDAR